MSKLVVYNDNLTPVALLGKHTLIGTREYYKKVSKGRTCHHKGGGKTSDLREGDLNFVRLGSQPEAIPE